MRLNFDPTIWGPRAWFFIETAILSYPDNPDENTKNEFYNFLKSLSHVLPCEKCRYNYLLHFNNNFNFKYLDNKEELFNFIVKLHNKTNNANRSEQDVLDFYIKKYNNNEYFTNNNNNNKINNNKYTYLFFIILIIIFIFIYKKN